MIIRLEYTCTEAERKEAQTLQQRQQWGRGSKWLTRIVLFICCVMAAATVYFRFRQESMPGERVLFGVLFVVAIIGLQIFKRLTRSKSSGPARLELSERELVIDGGPGGGRSAIPWSGFSGCLESPNLFALVDRTKTTLLVLPKRAFPDETAQNWLRAWANQPQSAAASTANAAAAPSPLTGSNGVGIALQLKYRDYVNHNFASWRIRAIFVGILALLGWVTLLSPPPNAVNPPLKTFAITIIPLAAILVSVVFLVSFIHWLMEKKFRSPQQMLFTPDGLEFVGQDGNGQLPWRTYKYYLENHWAFFVWHPQGSRWLMFPKRAFASPSDLAQFRSLVEKNLARSRWFYL